jgi:hypothetical protein
VDALRLPLELITAMMVPCLAACPIASSETLAAPGVSLGQRVAEQNSGGRDTAASWRLASEMTCLVKTQNPAPPDTIGTDPT